MSEQRLRANRDALLQRIEETEDALRRSREENKVLARVIDDLAAEVKRYRTANANLRALLEGGGNKQRPSA